MLKVLPESDSQFFGVVLSVLWVVRCGRMMNDASRVPWIKVPGSLLSLVLILVLAVYSRDVHDEFLAMDMGLYKYMYMRFAFWGFLSIYAIEVSQVLVLMFMMVRPFHCIFLYVTLLSV